MSRRLLFAAAASLFAACAPGFSLQATSPQRATTVGAVEVVLGPEVIGKKAAILEKLQVQAHMQAALLASFPAGDGPILRVTITQFRTGGFGPTRMHAIADMLNEQGNVAWTGEADSTTLAGGSKSARTQRVSQDILNKITRQIQ